MISPIPPTNTNVLFRDHKIMSCSAITVPPPATITIKLKIVYKTNINGAQDPHPTNIKCKTQSQDNTKSSNKIINFSTKKPPAQPAAAITVTNNKTDTINGVSMTKMTQWINKQMTTITMTKTTIMEKLPISIMKSMICKVLQAVMQATVTIRWNQT